MDKKQIILDFIKKQKLAVIATVGMDDKPESAVLKFGETENFELIIDTFSSSRKYKISRQINLFHWLSDGTRI